MNCDHVLGLIDAGPFADYPRAHLEAAWRHAGECATCGSALEAALVLTEELKVLARPAPPRELAPAVMARIARLDEARGSASEAGGAAHAADRWSIGTWSTWAPILGAIGVLMVIAPPFIAEAPSAGDNTPSSAIRDLLTNLPGMPATAGGLLVLAASLALYVAGLFSSIRGDADRAS